MIILKEAFRYQNYLSSLIAGGLSYLDSTDYVYRTKQKRNRSAVNRDAQDDEIEVKNGLDFDVPVDKLINFIADAITEKEKLSKAISNAKKESDFDIDATMALNKVKQSYLTRLIVLSVLKSKEIDREGTDYKFDVDGKQVPYVYPIKEVRTIDYDRNVVRKLIKKYRNETDNASNERERIELTTVVDYDPIWDVGTSLDEILLEDL